MSVKSGPLRVEWLCRHSVSARSSLMTHLFEWRLSRKVAVGRMRLDCSDCNASIHNLDSSASQTRGIQAYEVLEDARLYSILVVS